MNPTVRVRDLVRRFGARSVLNGVNLGIEPGEFVALLGRSGSGKSTLLRALAGLDHRTRGSGEIRVPERLSIAFQDARLLPWKRVIHNVVLGLRSDGALERGENALSEVDLSGRSRAWPSELSGGEQQRVALARSLVREPQLLLADEPFGALDALTRSRMHVLLRRLSDRHRPAVLLVTHDVDEAIELADRVVILDRGRIAANIAIDSSQTEVRHGEGLTALKARLLGFLGFEAPSPRAPRPPEFATSGSHPHPRPSSL